MTFAPPRTHLYILISFFIGVLCVVYIRSKDRFEKEPFSHLLVVTVWGGIWSYAISGFFYNYLAGWGLYDLKNAWGAFLVIGPVEEVSKLAALFSSYVIIRKQLNEPVDGLLYMACVAVGYSLIEISNHQTIERVESRWWFSKRWLPSEQTQAAGPFV